MHLGRAGGGREGEEENERKIGERSIKKRLGETAHGPELYRWRLARGGRGVGEGAGRGKGGK
jgi:hypothetical protein